MKITVRRASHYIGLLGVLLLILLAGTITYFVPVSGILSGFICLLLGQAILQRSTAKIVYQSSALFLLVLPHILMVLTNASIVGIGMRAADISPITAVLVGSSSLAVQLGEREIHGISRSVRPTLLSALIVILLVTMIFSVVGWSYVTSARNLQEKPDAIAVFVVFTAKVMPAWIAYHFLASAIKQKRRPDWFFWVLVVFQIVICNPANTGRFISLSALILIFLPYLKKSVWMILSPFLLPLMVLFVFPFLGKLRQEADAGIVSILEVLATLEFSTLMHTDNGVRFYWTGYEWGRQIVSGVFILLPRQILSFKSEGLGVAVAEHLRYLFTNVSLIPAYSGYVDFGIIGGTVIFGLILYFMYRYIQGTGKVILICLSPILVRGDWTTFSVAFYAFLVSGLLCSQIIRLRIFIPSRGDPHRKTTPRHRIPDSLSLSADQSHH